MRERKTEFRFFTVAEWEKEEAYLSQRHREGWRFTGVRLPGVYGFERCAPQEVVYRLDYNPEARAHREDLSLIHIFPSASPARVSTTTAAAAPGKF